ncbi:MAG: GDSL-type esterase/lipase family protein [Candidatus Eisenbacteria bacterium]
MSGTDRRGRSTAFLVNSVCAALVLAGLLATGEISVRTFGPKPDEGRYHDMIPGSPRRYGLTPGGTGIVGGEPLLVNSFGMRDHEYALNKSPRTFRIALLGDSYTFGVGVPLSATFGKLLEESLNMSDAGRRYEVMNFGVSGYNTVQELATLRESAARFAPDLVLVAYYLNDTEGPGDESERQLRRRIGWWKAGLVRIRVSLKRHSRLMAWLMHQGIILVRSITHVEHLSDIDFDRRFADEAEGWQRSRTALEEMKQVADSLHSRMFLVLIPLLVNTNDQYRYRDAHERILSYCAEIEVPSCDLLDAFMGLEAKRLRVSYLDPHLNEQAHRLAAAWIEKSMREQSCLPPGAVEESAGPHG